MSTGSTGAALGAACWAGSGSAVGSSGMSLTVPAYFAAACRSGAECGGGGGGPSGAGGGPLGSAGGAAGSGIAVMPGVPSWPAIHGSAVANACAANGQSCLPGWVTTAHVIPLALPNRHREFAAAVWSALRGGDDGAVPVMSNQPASPAYGP